MKDVIHNEISEKTSIDRKESLTMTESNVEKIVANMLGDLAARYAAKPKSAAENTPEKKEEMLSIKECKARIPGLSEYTLRKLIKQNKVISIRSGEGENGKYLVNFNSLREYLGFTDNKSVVD
ncbi:MAG: DNA-binding protein [Oscillospiraceae bacterium]